MPRTASRDWRIHYRGSSRTTRVRNAPGAIADLGRFTRATTAARQVALVSDTRVAALHAGRALESLERAGISASLVTVPAGERSKSIRHLSRLWDLFADLGLERSAAIVALGGGVVGDLAGFAAATWLRGLPWVCVPTTLLAQVDSGVGGKTAIDLVSGKNLVGAFHQPAGVLVDTEVLQTLPPRHVRAGLAEVVKTGMAVDASLFRWVEREAPRLVASDTAALEEVVGRTIRAKARVVARDEREREGGGRTALNYGHTLAHALEAVREYRGLLHGEAVAIGLGVAGRLSVDCAGLAPASLARLEALMERLGLPRLMPPTAIADLLSAMRRDKKRRGQEVRWVLTPRIGHASVPRLIPSRLVESALVEAGARVSSSPGRVRSPMRPDASRPGPPRSQSQRSRRARA